MPLRHDLRRGALLMLAATASFGVMSVLVKLLLARYPFTELMFFRNAGALPIVLLAGWRSGRLFTTRRIGSHAGRALAGMMGQGTGFFALTMLPLADQIALNYTQPLFVILLAIPFLGERPGPVRWAAVVLGFVGVLVVAFGQGGIGGGAALGYAVAAAGGFFSALSTMLVRQLSATESTTTIVMWQSLLMAAMAGLLLPFGWVTPSFVDLLLLITVGLIGGVSQVMLTESYASAQVSALGPYSYTGLIWGALFGWIIWGDAPGFGMLIGAALIIAAGLLVLRGEFGRSKS
ncbi:DMT family transporter [Muricoccus radiodurans]|uniref:DMT family transporter n=1 Tax=Muricoccus radiodurans TaxID=2231721 RepID=UPI003CF4F67E